MKFLKATLIKISIILLFLTFNDAYSQFGGFGKIKDAVDDVSNQGCDELERLKTNLGHLKKYLNDPEDNESQIPSYIKRVKENIKSVNDNCKHVNTDDYEKELEGYKKQWAEYEKKVEARENDGKFIKEKYWAVDKVAGHFGGYLGQFTKIDAAQSFYDDCKAVDYINTVKKINEIVEKYPQFKEDGVEYNYEYLQVTEKFPAKFKEAITNYFIAEVNKAIEESYALKAKGKTKAGEAKDKAKSGVLVCEGILMFFPGHPQISNVYTDAKAAYDKIAAEFDAAVYTSDFHKANVKKVVFSNDPIIIQKESSAGLKNVFKAGETIYAMIYFEGSINEVSANNNTFTVNMLVDGNSKVSHTYKAETEFRDKSYYMIEIAPVPENFKTNGGIKFTTALSELSPRGHKITMEISSGYGREPVASGEFDLDGASGLNTYATNVAKMKDMKLEKIRMKKAKMKDASLEKSILKAITSAGWKEKPLRAVITDEEWTYEKNILGVIISRVINAQVAVKREDGSCAIFWLSFKQDKNGSKWGTTKLNGVGGSDDIKCKNVNK